MSFITKRDLLASERCISWVTIGADTYVSVYNQTNTYQRVYKSTGGGPFTQILNVASVSSFITLFKVGTTLYAGYPAPNINSYQIYKYQTGSWILSGYYNTASSLKCLRYYNNEAYLLFSASDTNILNGATILAKFGGGVTSVSNNFTLVKFTGQETGVGDFGGRIMTSFDIDNTGNFFIAEQDAILLSGDAKIIKRTSGGVETTLLNIGPGKQLYDVSLFNGTLYLTKQYNSAYLALSKLSDLTVLATETILSTTLTNGVLGQNTSPRAARSAVINEHLYVAYHGMNGFNGSYEIFSVDPDDVITNYPAYTNSYINTGSFGHFTVEGNEIILGVSGKFVYEFVQVPEDPDPIPDPPPIVEDLTEELLIEVRESPCNAITLCWLNSFGAWESYTFEDTNKTFESQIKTRIEAEYERYVEQLDSATNYNGITTKTIERSITCGADNLDADIYIGLLDLMTSPAVLMLINEDPLQWQAVRISPGTWKYTDSLKNLEFTVELPNLIIQRS